MHERNGRSSEICQTTREATKAGENQEAVGGSLSAGLKYPGGSGTSILSDDGLLIYNSPTIHAKIAIGCSNLRESSSMQAGSFYASPRC